MPISHTEPQALRYIFKSKGKLHVSVSKYKSDKEFLTCTASILDVPHVYVATLDTDIATNIRKLR